MPVLTIQKTGDLDIGGGEYHDAHYQLVTPDGEVLAGHICSHDLFAIGDLHDRRAALRAELCDRYGSYVIAWQGRQYRYDSAEGKPDVTTID